MERQLFAFTTRLLIMRQEKLWHIGFKRKWALIFAKGKILVSCWFASIAGNWTRSQIGDPFLCNAERHVTYDQSWVADCLLQNGRGCIVLFIYFCITYLMYIGTSGKVKCSFRMQHHHYYSLVRIQFELLFYLLYWALCVWIYSLID